WLEELRAHEVAAGAAIERPAEKPGDPSQRVGERERRARELAARLLAGVPELAEERSEEQQAVWLLAHLLDWHRREEKAPWWEYFRLRDLSDEELLDETAALAGLEFVERVPVRGRTPVDRYRFPAQETRIREDSSLRLPGPEGRSLGRVVAIDLIARTVDIGKSGAQVHPTSVFEHETYGSTEQAESLMRFGEWVAGRWV